MGGNNIPRPKRKTNFDRYLEELTRPEESRRVFNRVGLKLDAGLQLYHLRMKADMTVAACARKLGCTAEELKCMEEGEYDFELPLLFAIADVFGKKLQIVFK